MKCIYLTPSEIQAIDEALDEYIDEHCLDELPTSNGFYFGNNEVEEHDAKRMNDIQSIFEKIYRK